MEPSTERMDKSAARTAYVLISAGVLILACCIVSTVRQTAPVSLGGARIVQVLVLACDMRVLLLCKHQLCKA